MGANQVVGRERGAQQLSTNTKQVGRGSGLNGIPELGQETRDIL